MAPSSSMRPRRCQHAGHLPGVVGSRLLTACGPQSRPHTHRPTEQPSVGEKTWAAERRLRPCTDVLSTVPCGRPQPVNGPLRWVSFKKGNGFHQSYIRDPTSCILKLLGALKGSFPPFLFLTRPQNVSKKDREMALPTGKLRAGGRGHGRGQGASRADGDSGRATHWALTQPAALANTPSRDRLKPSLCSAFEPRPRGLVWYCHLVSQTPCHHTCPDGHLKIRQNDSHHRSPKH